jgi:hypothetical protein
MGLHGVNAKSEFENLCNFTELPVTLHRKMAESWQSKKNTGTQKYSTWYMHNLRKTNILLEFMDTS